MKIAFEVKDIIDAKELFGREKTLHNLKVDAALKQNVNIIGARRFGKTCVLKSILPILKEDDEIGVYPVYLDLKSEDIRGTDAVYRYFIGILTCSLYRDNVFTEKERFGSVEIVPSEDWTELAENLEKLSSSRLQSIFQRIVKFFSEFMSKTILFMIDEYEYLFKYALDTSAGFMKLRSLSSDSNTDGSRPFCFWLTGSTPWDELISTVPGSGEANTISGYEYIQPIDYASFKEMIAYECTYCNDKDAIALIQNQIEFIFKKSGGVPFYGKCVICSYILKHHILPTYSECNSYFKELTSKANSVGDYKILKELSISPKKLPQSIFRDNLYYKGIIAKSNKDIYTITIGFLVEFINSEMNDKTKEPTVPETFVLVDSITKTIELINKQRINYKQIPVFKAVNDSASQEKDLRTPCYTAEQLADFAGALYNMYFERSKDGRGQQLHHRYFVNNTFSKCADIARHSIGKGHEMDNFITRDGQFTRADLYLEIMGSADELSTGKEFYRFQIEMLKRFNSTLEEMFSFIKKNRA